ncbi:uncharacterized protein LOC144442570 [Glandiceps talaboti]
MAKVNKCCSSFCGCLTFTVGMIYFFIILGLMVYCFAPLPSTMTSSSVLTCMGATSLLEFVDLFTLLYVLLLITTGCLGIAAARTESESVVASLMVSAVLTFFMSNLAIVEACLSLSALTMGNNTDAASALTEAYGNSLSTLDLASMTSPLLVITISLLCAVAGMVFAVFCTILACCGVCNHDSYEFEDTKTAPQGYTY